MVVKTLYVIRAILVLDSILDGQPVKASHYRRDRFSSAGANHRAGQQVLENFGAYQCCTGKCHGGYCCSSRCELLPKHRRRTSRNHSQWICGSMCQSSPYVVSGWAADTVDGLLKFREQSMVIPRLFTLSAIVDVCSGQADRIDGADDDSLCLGWVQSHTRYVRTSRGLPPPRVDWHGDWVPSSWSEMSSYNVSSAYWIWLTKDVIHIGDRSDIRLNRIGLSRTELSACTPNSTAEVGADCWSPTLTNWNLSAR